MSAAPPPSDTGVSRPRVEGDRELEILEATLDVLADVGYDRLTMDAVATKARASKATLYRRWSNKSSLVLDALIKEKELPEPVDTGSFREDLMQSYCQMSGQPGQRQVAMFTNVLSAISRDPEFAKEFRTRFVGPKEALAREIYERAKARGEIRADLDVDLFGPAIAGIVLHRLYILGEQPTEDLITRVIDEIVVPAATTPIKPQKAKESHG